MQVTPCYGAHTKKCEIQKSTYNKFSCCESKQLLPYYDPEDVNQTQLNSYKKSSCLLYSAIPI